MPQLHFHDFVPQLVWLAITFILLYVVMAIWGLPQLRAAVEGRQQRRASDLARAAELKATAEAALAAHDKALAEARAEAQSVLKQASDRIAAEAAERQRDLAASLAEHIEAAERRIDAMKEEAVGEIRGIAIDVGRAVVEKLTGAPPDAARLTAAVDNAVSERAR